MHPEFEKVTVTIPTYTVSSNTDEEIKIIEMQQRFSDACENFMRELCIKKDEALLNTWFSSLKDNELMRIHTILTTIMQEKNIKM